MEITYQIIEKIEFENKHREILASMLELQGKVQGDLKQKIDRCRFLCIATVDNNIVAVGAIKEKTSSDFSAEKSDLSELSSEFKWEFGYFYTKEEYAGKGMASMIAKLLLEKYGKDNLMASTEITANPAMVSILQKNGFRLYGKPWKSSIHENYLGLFLKFK